MNLDLSDEDLAFRDEVRSFLDEHLTPELRAAGSRTTSVFCEPRHSLPWQRILHARGWAAPSWPVEYGGPGWSEVQRSIFAAECARASAPGLAPMGLRMAGPVIMGYGTPERRTIHPVENAMQTNHRRNVDANVQVCGPFGNHQLQQIGHLIGHISSTLSN